MNRIFFILLFSILSITTYSQTLNSSEENDPAAKRILDKLKAEYDSYSSMEVQFELTMELPGQAEEIQKGFVIQQGDMYKMDLDQRAIYSNNKYVWLHIKKNNEVQINDAEVDEEANMLSPKDMLSLYDSGKYVYMITGEPTLDGKKVTQIEFKPLDRNSEFSKLTLFVGKADKKMHQMKVFSKDGSRYTLKINDIVANKKYTLETFSFDERKFPGVHIEDLRID